MSKFINDDEISLLQKNILSLRYDDEMNMKTIENVVYDVDCVPYGVKIFLY